MEYWVVLFSFRRVDVTMRGEPVSSELVTGTSTWNYMELPGTQTLRERRPTGPSKPNASTPDSSGFGSDPSIGSGPNRSLASGYINTCYFC